MGAGIPDNASFLARVIPLVDVPSCQMRTCAEEVKARGAQITVITDNPKLAEGLDPRPIVIPSNVSWRGVVAFMRLVSGYG